MQLTVFGGTGGTGKQVVRRALDTGHTVTAVAREPSRITITHERLHTVRGDVLELPTLDGSMDAADVVISALGAGNGRTPTTVYSTGVANILTAMARAGVRRFVAISALPVTPRDEVGVVQRLLVYPILYRFFGESYTDMARMEQLLHRSDADWTIVRPPRLTNGPATGRFRTALNEHLPRAGKISRADLADAMLCLLTDPRAVRAVVTTAY